MQSTLFYLAGTITICGGEGRDNRDLITLAASAEDLGDPAIRSVSSCCFGKRNSQGFLD